MVAEVFPLADIGLPLGARVPDFTLPDARGRLVRLAERLRTGPVVLIFCRSEGCSCCAVRLRAYLRALPELAEFGAALITISPRPPVPTLSTEDEHRRSLDVLGDVEQRVFADFGLRRELSGEPVPATFVLDRQGVVRARHVGVDHGTTMEPADALAAVEAITLG
ncbi:peroxiredoxin family protein [Allokutzneria oryzae]|uniref:thioredoxin-dependent peroxiredoxin n=1 Tax=Allokutzneria oryzae TaxID=1378989 RepID=A0ABV6A8X2_9PSEU